MNRRTAVMIGLLSLGGLLSSGGPAPALAQEGEAKKLFQEALTLKAAGNAEKAALTFRQAIDKDRTILGENDEGLIEHLRAYYAEKLAANAQDSEALEGLGFVAANCDGDPATALDQYSKALAVTQDETARTRLQGIVDGLKARVGAPTSSAAAAAAVAGSSTSTATGQKTNSEQDAVKKEAEEAKAEAEAKREAEIADLTSSKESREARIPQLEEEIKSLEEENDSNRRRYLSTNDRRYKRKEDAAEQAIEQKKKEIERLRTEIDKFETKITKLRSSGSGAAAPAPAEEPTED